MGETVREEFGRGLLWPLQRDGKGDFQNASGLTILGADIRMLFTIRGPSRSIPGELPWRTDLGSRLGALKHRKLADPVIEALSAEATMGVMQKWERRARQGTLSMTKPDGPTGTTRRLELTYHPVGRRTGPAPVVALPVKE